MLINIILSFFVTLIIAIILSKPIFRIIKLLQNSGQPIRKLGPSSHLTKQGTPTMGGFMILIPIFISAILLLDLTNINILAVLFILFTFGIIGFLDDYLKIKFNNSNGISARQKFIMQLFAALIFYFMVHDGENLLYFKNWYINLSYLYVFFILCVIVGSSNAVNLTDGLDGLAAGCVLIVNIVIFVIISLCSDVYLAKIFNLKYIANISQLMSLVAMISASLIVFLWYNIRPAKIFMGDIGSLSLGAYLASLFIILKQEILFVIIGFVFVIETLSVILQVIYFKISKGKRIFLMTPIHHHFEKKGLSENNIVVKAWLITVVCSILGLSILLI